jgi:hypothetical protein
MREKLIELLEDSLNSVNWDSSDYPYTDELADCLIANGVTIQPAVPGPEMGHDMAERCYRNGEEAMREKVIDYLREQKGITMGAIRSTLNDAIEKVRKL